MATRWASNTGSTIIGSLNIDTIAWITGSTVRYTFSGSPDLSGVVVGHQLQATGCTNALHNGTFEITAVSNASDYIEVTNTAISDASNDESSSPGTGTAKTGASLVQEPTSAKQALGWLNGEKPPAGYFNWQAQNAGRVQVATADIGYSTISSSSYTAIGGEGYTVCPTKSSAAWGSTVSASSATLITGSEITPITTSGKIALVGFSCSCDYANTNNNGKIALEINGTPLTGNFEGILPAENYAATYFNLITSLTGGPETYGVNAYESGGTSNIVTTNGKTWACEFSDTAAKGTANGAGDSTASTSYVDLASSSITISPTNNPVLLIANLNLNTSSAAHEMAVQLYDGAEYGGWNYRSASSAGQNKLHPIAWLTPELNGSQTFKVRHKVVNGTEAVLYYNVIALEIQGDYKRTAIAAGTCAATDTEATITDGSTPLSYSFTPVADIQYLAILTLYSERTAGTGYITFRIKVGGVEVLKIDHAREQSSGDKSPVTIAIPTGLLSADAATTVTATAQTSDGSTTYDLKTCALFLVEAPSITNGYAGDPATATITNAKPWRVRVDWSSQRLCSADVALSYALYEDVNSGGAVEVFSKTLTAPGTADQDCSISWLRPTDLAEGDDVTYTVRAKMASGNVVFAGGYLSATEVPSL